MDQQNNNTIPQGYSDQNGDQSPNLAYQQIPVAAAESDDSFGPRRLSFFILVLKTFAGLAGGIAGSLALLLIFLATSSILQPVLGSVVQGEAAGGEISTLFMVVLLGMIFTTSLISSLLSVLLLSYTERERYNRIPTAMVQVFIVNIVIFAFAVPVFFTASTARIELTAFAAALQIILSATASALILELVHDQKYALLAVYNTILAILVGSGINFFLYYTLGNATILLFAALPIIWALIGFSQAALAIFYYWIYQNWGSDFLATSTSFGADYGVPDQSEEEEELPKRPDIEGSDFLKGN